jgi:hypothetical protein
MMGRMHLPYAAGFRVASVAALFAMGAIRAQDATWFVRGSDANTRIAGVETRTVHGVVPAPVMTPAGDYEVHFGANALGKPGSLALHVPEDAIVQIAIEPAAATRVQVIAAEDPRREMEVVASTEGAKVPWRASVVAGADERDYRVTARGVRNGSTGAFGVVARWIDRNQHYRFVWDLARSELRLERQLGPDAYVLARVAAPTADDQPHELGLQVEGFRVQAFLDDVLVVQVLDGAIGRGGFGCWASGDAVHWESLASAAPVDAAASSALVTTAGEATMVAATAVAAGHLHVLQLHLDRPYALVPRNVEGSELWLLQRPAAPEVLLGDWRGSIGSGAIGEVSRNGLATAELHWPTGAALRLQSVLVTMLLVSANGEQVIGSTPSVPLRM